MNYYLLAQDVTRLAALRWNAETSMLKTLAAKHKSTVAQMAARHKAKVITGDGPRTCFEASLKREGRKDLIARFGGIILRQDRRAVRYPRAIWDDQLGRWVSDGQVAEVPYTAFTSRTGQAMTARLIVRRVKDLNCNAAPGAGRAVHRLAVPRAFTDSPFEIQAEEQHRGHAQAEQVFADWTDGPLAHLPSGRLPRQCRLARARRDQPQLAARRGALASMAYAKARGATIRRDLIHVAARTARHGRGHLTVHLPEAGTASTSGRPVRRRLRTTSHSGLPAQIRSVTATPAGHPETAPQPGTQTSRRKGERHNAHAQNQLNKLDVQGPAGKPSVKTGPWDRG